MRVESGPLGGDMVIGADIVIDNCHALFLGPADCAGPQARYFGPAGHL